MRVHGINSVVEAIKAGAAKVVYLKDENGRRNEVVKLARKAGIKIVKKNVNLGVAADVDFRYSNFDELLDYKSFILYADRVEDPRNLGALIRSAVFFGCSGVAIKKRKTTKITDAVVRTSAGAVFHTKIAFAGMFELKKAKKLGYRLVAAELDGEDIYSTKMALPSILIIGGEDKGVSASIKRICDNIVKIPGRGNIGSLNLSVAAGILMYELSRTF